MKKLTIQEVIDIFADKTDCSVQHSNCPCNSCFHSIDADFQHICWLIILGMRGDYDSKEIIHSIRKELKI